MCSSDLTGSAALDEFGEDCHGDLAMRGVSEVEPDRDTDPVDHRRVDPAIGEVTTEGLAALAGRDATT